MNMTTVIRCLSVAAVVVMTGCADSHSDNKEKEENHGHEEHGNEIVIKHEQIEKLGIKTTIVNPSEFQNVIKCGGEILPSPLSQAVVAAKSDGIIKLSAGINEGVEIKNGGVVCSISSAGISGGDPRADARTQLTAAKRIWNAYRNCTIQIWLQRKNFKKRRSLLKWQRMQCREIVAAVWQSVQYPV